MSRRTPSARGDESGMALVAALLAIVILSGLVVVFVSTAVTTSRVTGISRDAEIALHVGEAGADEVIARVNWDEDHVTTDSAGNEHEVDLSTMSEEEQRAWVLGQVDDLDPLVSGTRGEGFGIRPRHPTTKEPYDIVFGAGLVPGKSDRQRVRVIKIRYDRSFFQPQHGLMSCGDLEVGGNAKILGDHGHVHANGTVDIDGTSHEIAKKLSAGDAITGSSPNAGTVEVPSPEEYCPEIHALDLYGRANPPYTCYPGTACEGEAVTGTDGRKVLWWDLCPGGTVRRAGSSPCTGEVVFEQGKGAANHLGWSYKSTANEWSSTSIQSGIYYVHEANAAMSGGSGTVTVLVEEEPLDDGETGNLEWVGNATIDAALEGLTLVTDRDLRMRGTGSGAEVEGLVTVDEQAHLSGTASIDGSVYIRDAPHTSNSPVSKSRIEGTFTITYNTELDVPVIGTIRITAWNEL